MKKSALVVVHFGEKWLQENKNDGILSSDRCKQLIRDISIRAREEISRNGEVIYLPIKTSETAAPSFLPEETYFIDTPSSTSGYFLQNFLSYQLVQTRKILIACGVTDVEVCGAWKDLCVGSTRHFLEKSLPKTILYGARIGIGWEQHKEFFSPLSDGKISRICEQTYRALPANEMLCVASWENRRSSQGSGRSATIRS